jgi:4-amino-4-deoxy-L-arabinose transferase-like glycosyltransferase
MSRRTAPKPTPQPVAVAAPLPLKLGLWPVALYLCLGIGAALVVPCDYSGNPRPTPPDEGAHIGFIQSLLKEGRLPVFFSQNDNYEAHQPPLYYLSAVPAYVVAQAVGVDEQGNLNSRGIVLLRLWSVLVGALAVWAAWLVGRRLLGGLGWIALAPALFLAVWPGRVMIISAVTNDGLAEGLCLVAFALCVAVLAEGFDRRRVLLLGVVTALALMTKSTSVVLIPIVLLAFVWRAGEEQRAGDETAPRRLLGWLAVVAGAVVLLAGWWYVRNQILYGDPLAARAFEELFSKDRATPEYFLSRGMSGTAYYMLVMIHTALSFWGVYGQANVYHAPGYYALGLGLGALALVGLGRWAWQRRQAPPLAPWVRQSGWLGLCALALVIVLFLRFNAAFYQAQARYLLAASGPLSLLLTVGWHGVGGSRWGRLTLGLALGLVALMMVGSVIGYGWLTAMRLPPPFFGG